MATTKCKECDGTGLEQNVARSIAKECVECEGTGVKGGGPRDNFDAQNKEAPKPKK